MKTLFLILVLFNSIIAKGQSDVILKELGNCNIAPAILTMAFNEDWENTSYDLTTNSTSEGSTLTSVEIVNDMPTKSGPMKVLGVKITVNYKFDDTQKKYVVEKNDWNVHGKFLGAEAKSRTLREYSNFKL